MKISHQIKVYLLTLILTFSSSTFADGVLSKSMMISFAVPVTAGIYTYTIDDREGLKELFLSSLITAHLTTLLKYTVDRERPNGDDRYSFPSGHAAASFVGASYLHHRYGLNWGLPFYGIATAISFQRVNVKDHYWTDVIAGAAIGYFTASFFTVRYPHVWMKPTFDPRYRNYGVEFGTTF